MDSSMAESVKDRQWYLAVNNRSIGPITTDLVIRGIESGKVPLTAWICQVGAASWSALSSFGEFQEVVDRVLAAQVPANQQLAPEMAAEPPRDERVSERQLHASEEAERAGAPSRRTPPPKPSQSQLEAATAAALVTEGTEGSADVREILPYERSSESDALPSFSLDGGAAAARMPEVVTSIAADPGADEQISREEFPSFSDQSGQREVLPGLGVADEASAVEHDSSSTAEASASAANATEEELAIDVTFDEDQANTIDWQERFQSYFLVGSEVELPEEEKLLESLRAAPRSTFLHDEALWNLSLCLAFGSDEVANTSARTFFEAVGPEHAPERIEWVCRTLLSKGFMPSGIPRSEGMRGIDVLRGSCPGHLIEALEREAVD